jgi:hypothetical protein
MALPTTIAMICIATACSSSSATTKKENVKEITGIHIKEFERTEFIDCSQSAVKYILKNPDAFQAHIAKNSKNFNLITVVAAITPIDSHTAYIEIISTKPVKEDNKCATFLPH